MRYRELCVGRGRGRMVRAAMLLLVPAFIAVLLPQFITASPQQMPPPRPDGQGVTGSGSTPVVRQYGPVNGSNPTLPPPRVPGPVTSSSAPPNTRSLYIRVASPSNTTALANGQLQGIADIASPPGADGNAVVLDFGAPYIQAGVMGTIRPKSSAAFLAIDDVERITEAYGQGYISSTNDLTQLSPTLHIIVGVNNDTILQDDPGHNSYPLSDHARAWADMLTRINGYFAGQGWTPHLRVDAGNDIEMDYNTTTITYQWVDAFSGANAGWFMYNFGTATCPTVGDGTVNQPCYTTQQQDWTQENIWYVSYGSSAAQAFPEMYNSTLATEWYLISLYGYRSKGGAYIPFMGTLTQNGACQQLPPGSCNGTNDDPGTGWANLQTAINGTPVQWAILWASDIRDDGTP
jgi:hypothetical protein